MATFGIITSSYSITQEDFDLIDLEIKAEEYDEYMLENELIMDIEHEEEKRKEKHIKQQAKYHKESNFFFLAYLMFFSLALFVV